MGSLAANPPLYPHRDTPLSLSTCSMVSGIPQVVYLRPTSLIVNYRLHYRTQRHRIQLDNSQKHLAHSKQLMNQSIYHPYSQLTTQPSACPCCVILFILYLPSIHASSIPQPSVHPRTHLPTHTSISIYYSSSTHLFTHTFTCPFSIHPSICQ